MSWQSILKGVVYRNKHTGKQYTLEGYDMVVNGKRTYQVAILSDDSGEKSRWEQKFIDGNFDLVGEQ
jgi:hypothetical protein